MTTTGEEHYLRSSLLLLKGGTFITRKVVIREEQKEIRNSGRDLDDLLTEKKGKLEHEFRNHKHREKLFPANGKTEVEKWDISLLTGVLQVVFRSSLSGNERKAVRSIKLQRNDVYAHRATADLSFDDYSDICVELKEALRNLAAEFPQEVKTECEDIIDSCLNGPIDIKSHIEHLKCVADTDKMFSAILEKMDANGKQTMENIKEVVEQEHVCLKKGIAEDISNSQEAVCKTIRETQLTKTDLTALVIDAVQQALQEQRRTRKVKVVDSELEVSGKDVDKPNIDLAERMIKTVTNEAIRRTQTSEEFKDIREAIQEILDEIACRTGVKALAADIACVVISFSYDTYEQLLNFLVYLDSEDIKLRLAKLATLLSHRLKTKEQLHLSTSLSVKCLQNILKELETDSQSEYKRKIHIPIQFDSVEGMAHVWNYFENGGATNSLNKLSEALSAKLGTKIKLTSSLNVDQFRSALDEFGSENTSLQLTGQSQVHEDTMQVHGEGIQMTVSETSNAVLKDPKSDESQEIAGGIDLNASVYSLTAGKFHELQAILDSNPDNTNWRALANVVQKKYNIRQHLIDGITYRGGSASSALLEELGAQGMTVKELQDYLNEIGLKFALGDKEHGGTSSSDEPSEVAKETDSKPGGKTQSEILEPKRSFSDIQKLTTSKPFTSGDVLSAVNVDTRKNDSQGKADLYDRTKLSGEDLRNEDLTLYDRQQLNITETVKDEADMDEIEDKDISLRHYQQELAAPALQGKNVIIVAPTGSGKTRVAMRIIQEHIRQQKGRGIAKVIFLVNQVALANQQGEACRELLRKYTSKVITGESQRKSECLKDFIDKRDILVVTAQVLMDALLKKEISGINKFSLVVFDECHHTHANHTFNQIMGRYMDLKFDKPHAVLPQIVGLTASVGVGKARNEEKAVEHIKHLMANLDAQVICTVQKNMGELRQHVSLPEEETHKVPRRQNDAFHDNMVKLMNVIEKRMAQSSLVKEIPEASKIESALKAPAQKGTAQYTQWVSKLWRETALLKSSEARRFLNPCRTHLEHYNNALIIYNDARMVDALGYLDAQISKENALMDENESILHGAFKILRSAKFRNCPNPKLDKLCEMIIKAYEGNFDNSRGIVFVKTRDLSKAILSWMKETPGLRELNPIQFVGTNMAADKGGMTKAEQVDALEYFRNGKHKLIIATSVAEEGLDISKCNLVIRYDHVTNEIAMVQSRGRGRAADSKYYVIAEANTGMAEKEELNMIREVMMRKAIIQLQEYIHQYPSKFLQEIHKFQDEANLDRQLKSLGSRRKLITTGQFELRCIKCGHFICWSDDVKKIQDSHHVVIDEHLAERATFVNSGPAGYQDDAVQFVGKLICKECGGNLGVICIHRTMEFPVLKIGNFLIVDASSRQETCNKWKSVPFHVAPLTSEDWKEILKAKKDKGDI